MNASLRTSSCALTILLSAGAVFAQHAQAADVSPVAEPAAVKVAAADAPASLSAVIVTGTRERGLRAEDSPAPIQVLGADMLEHSAQPDLIQALGQNLPSFVVQAFGFDTAGLTTSAKLRGLSANDTLVLINGKRRHGTANLAVDQGPFQGSAAADLNFIPIGAIDHIEVLQDGAAAQYGTDAIAGVINIILKSSAKGGTITANGGGYFDGGGASIDGSANVGFKPIDNSFVNLTLETKTHGHSDRGAIDPRLLDPANNTGPVSIPNVPGYPYLNHISGDANSKTTLLAVNAGYDFTEDAELYLFGTFGHKAAQAFENYRLPSKLPTVYPAGFSPMETIGETDYALTVGYKDRFGAWNFDASSTFGQDDNGIGNVGGANPDLVNDFGFSPNTFHVGEFTATQWTNNIDVSREFNVGLKAPLNLAMGLEQRAEAYAIGAGDAASTYKGGAAAYPGFSSTDAGKHKRDNEAAYIDVALSPIDKLKVDLAARYEKFSDFGSTTVDKATLRYDFTPSFALRGTAASGFRAPTLAEEFYSATNVAPNSAFVQLPPNSAGARLVGVNGLKPETSNSFSFGAVIKPADNMNLTLDIYQIEIHDRVVGSGQVYGTNVVPGTSTNPCTTFVQSAAVNAAITANGNTLPGGICQSGINIFTNAANTRNQGLDALFTMASKYQDIGTVDWSASLNINKVKVTKINQQPAQLTQALLDKTAISDLETSSPKYRLNLGGVLHAGTYTINLHENIYGPASEYNTADGVSYFQTTVERAFLTDLEIADQLSKSWLVAVGANNLFNHYPTKYNSAYLASNIANGNGSQNVNQYPLFSPYGINGGYYYARASYQF